MVKRKKLSRAQYKKIRERKAAASAKQKGAILKFLSEDAAGARCSQGTEESSGITTQSEPIVLLSGESSSDASEKPPSSPTPLGVEKEEHEVTEQPVPEEEMVEQNMPEVETIEPSHQCIEFRFGATERPCTVDGNEQLRHFLVSHGPQQVNKFQFPKDSYKRSFHRRYYRRELPNLESVDRPWLQYSESRNAIFCFCCKLFPSKAAVSVPCTTGYNDWKNITRLLSTHEKADYHTRSFCKWKDLETRIRLNLTIEETNKELVMSETQHWRKVLKRLIILVRTLAMQNIAFRGRSKKLYERSNGNFLKFVEAMSEFDAVLEKHVKRIVNKETHNHYLGPGIQNEIIDLLAVQIRKMILVQRNAAKYYSIILDCTPDISHKEQMTLMVRFVTATEDPESGSENVSIKEHFLSFIEVDDTTGAGMTKVLLKNLETFQMDLEDMRGQGYDNGSNMKGKSKGVQAQVRGLNPRAFYVPCNSHSLNLVISDAATSCVEAQHLATTHQWFTLKPLSTTRWESRIDAVKAIRNQLGNIDDALTAVMEDPTLTGTTKSKTISDVRGLQKKICNFKFVCGLVVWYNILFEVNITSKRLQDMEADLYGAVEQIENTRLYLRNYRSDEKFEDVINTAKKLAEELGIDGNFPSEQCERVRHTTRQFDYESRDEPVTDPKQRFKVDFFFLVLDCVWESLNYRFEQLKEHSSMFGLLYTIPKVMDSLREDIRQQCDQLEKALSHNSQRDIDAEEFCYELYALCRYLPTDCKTPRAVLEYICKTKMSTIFPNVCVAIRILLTLPVTVASGERSFSKLKLIKTYLRSTMTQERLVGLATISIEHELAHSLNLDEAIQAFASQTSQEGTFVRLFQ
ncbi:hypothetical protein GDO86_017106 [Hymenochirus boettgeri]|uniref:TTF-type domain-containing protein n=1 Tax=Hymenochirus boettgeri TaxID=247094 RepID=A0A8T2IMA2_9PIPI|nr:hypothetical protein GDO86_017106 [Hymenochirus boettgeri]